LLHDSQSFIGHEIDHIKSVKHGGSNEADNLAYACYYCNQHKGSDIGTALPPDDEYVRFYPPRKDTWLEHFEFNGSLIVAKTSYAQATINILRFNEPDRLIERQILSESGAYPHYSIKSYFEGTQR
jgi:hypothetical protein